MSIRPAPLLVSAEAMSRITALSDHVTIDMLQRAELAVQDVLTPLSASMLIDQFFHTADPLERERIVQLLEAPR